MNARLKAIELRDKHAKYQTYTIGFEVDAHSEFVRMQRAKKSALITVDGILSVLFQHHEIDYWKDVKTELEALK